VGCWLQSLVDPLCEASQYDRALTIGEYKKVSQFTYATTAGLVIFSEALLKTPFTRLALKEWLDLAAMHGVTIPDNLSRISKGYTIANKIGMFFAAGTSCSCCLGWRIGALSLALAGTWVWALLG
jgi:hypothetical protein